MTDELMKLRKQPHWSFSSLNGFVNCSLQWAFKYIYDKEQENTPVALLFGSAFHRTAEWIAIGRQHGIYVTSEDSKEYFSYVWEDECKKAENLYQTKENWEKLNITGQNIVATLNQEWLEDDILSVNQAFRVTLPGISKPLIGEIDLVVRDNIGNPILVDWKSAAKKWGLEKANNDLQATCFLYAWKQLYNWIPYFRYDVFTKTKVANYSQHYTLRCESDFTRLIHLMKMVEKAVKAEVFLPNESSFFCNGCQYKSACRSWHVQSSKTIFIPQAA